MTSRTPKAQLDSFLDEYDPAVAKLARASLAKMRKLVPGALELVYDNYNALVVAFGATGRASEVVLSIAVYPRYASVFFLHGATLSDPTKLLRGDGKQVRQLVVRDARVLDDADVRRLVAQALSRAPVPIDPRAKRRIVVRSISAKRRPRRPSEARLERDRRGA